VKWPDIPDSGRLYKFPARNNIEPDATAGCGCSHQQDGRWIKLGRSGNSLHIAVHEWAINSDKFTQVELVDPYFNIRVGPLLSERTVVFKEPFRISGLRV
jgi:hypothetical protein